MLSRGNRWFSAILLVMSSRLVSAGSGSEPLNVTYRTSTSEVRLTFFATDEKNHPIQNVGKDDFAIIDGDLVVRGFRSLVHSEETVLDVVILVDTSASVATRLQSMMNDILRLISRKQVDGKISVLSFAGLQTNVLCSSDCSGVQAQQKMLAMHAAGATPLYDALTYSAEFISDRPTPGARPVLILFSDGDDTISETSEQDALQAVISAGALLYTVDVNVFEPSAHGKNRSNPRGSTVLRQMAEATGGRYFSTREEAANALQSALDDLRSSYVVTYQLPRRAAGFHSLRILPKHNANLQFHCRDGYFYGTGVP